MKSAASLPLVAILLLAVFVVGCGGAEKTERKNAYVREVNTAQTKFSETVATVSAAITPKSTPAQDRRTLQRFQKAIESVVADLNAIAVPSEVKTEHKQLVAAMSGFGTDIAQANDALENPTTPTLDQAQRRIGTATETVNARIDEAIAAINAKLAND